MKQETHAYELFRPLTILAIISVAMLFVGGLTMAFSIDNAAKYREESLISNGLVRQMNETQTNLALGMVWDDAVLRLGRRDGAWAAHNVGRTLYDMANFKYSFVLDGADRPIFAYYKGKAGPVALYDSFATIARDAVMRVRREERNDRRSGAAVRAILTSAQTHTVANVDGETYVVMAVLVQPDFDRLARRNPPAPILVAAVPMDAAFLDHLSRRYMQPGLLVRPGDAPVDDDLAWVAVRDDRGQQVATLRWVPGKPGTGLAVRLAVPALALFGLFLLVLMVLYERGWRAAQKLIASEAKASHLAYHDPLTGLPNRIMFFERLGGALDHLRRQETPIAVHCLDLDRFKEINDTYGHQMGDELIIAAARRIAAICRRSDMFARLSGDEFAIVQMDASPAAAMRLADRVITAMHEPIELSGGVVHISCSVGVNVVADPGATTAEALRHADLALYRAKHGGRGQYCFFEPEMDAALRLRRDIEGDLRIALRERQLYMVYQPQVDLEGRVVGVEALLRWRHPERGEVAPALFVPIAEECGLISQVGQFTLREAFLAGLRWDGLRVAVNISASQLRMRDFHDQICALVDECGVNPRHYELEITEGLLLGDDPVTHETLRKLRAMGFCIALDDFGTGYSSLSYLQRYPIDKIKIDRSFIVNLETEHEARAVVQAIVRLAHTLRLQVVAEGVETHAQRAFLLTAGCELIQGFLYSPPVKAVQVPDLCRGRVTADWGVV